MWFITGEPRLAYHLSYEVEVHAAATYGKYLAVNGHDDKILEILNDELEHPRELQNYGDEPVKNQMKKGKRNRKDQ
ncbi:MAG: hypothetical protein CM15mV3_0830 [Caudoviricetes sp.]|nr:MAG: hypothetical protein CM15mV3_0830 [Caudoviricetes sp.]